MTLNEAIRYIDPRTSIDALAEFKTYSERVETVVKACEVVVDSLKARPFVTGANVGRKTNADRIRSMSDDRLRDFLCNMAYCGNCRFGSAAGCTLLDWMQKPCDE